MSFGANVRVFEFIKLGRPKFLVGGLLFYALGASLSTICGVAIDGKRYVWGQVIISLTQLMTHYSNDYFDLNAARANSTPTRGSGGSRILVRGSVPPIAALLAALVLGSTALCLTLAL